MMGSDSAPPRRVTSATRRAARRATMVHAHAAGPRTILSNSLTSQEAVAMTAS